MLLMWWLEFEGFFLKISPQGTLKRNLNAKLAFCLCVFILFVSIGWTVHFVSQGSVGRRREGGNLCKKPGRAHDITSLLLYLVRAPGAKREERKASPEALWLSDTNVAALLSHATHGLQSVTHFSVLDKTLLCHPRKLQNNNFSMPYLIEQRQGKRSL